MKIVAFDVESNGLHGMGFAVGGVVYDSKTHQVTTDYLALRCPIRGRVDTWVAENVLPQIKDMAKTHNSAKTMRADFWAWLQRNKQDAIVLVDVGYPVEARFLAKCQDDDKSRAWEAPYPLHELASILLTFGLDPDMERKDPDGVPRQNHHPVNDALVAAKIAAKLINSTAVAIEAL